MNKFTFVLACIAVKDYYIGVHIAHLFIGESSRSLLGFSYYPDEPQHSIVIMVEVFYLRVFQLWTDGSWSFLSCVDYD